MDSKCDTGQGGCDAVAKAPRALSRRESNYSPLIRSFTTVNEMQIRTAITFASEYYCLRFISQNTTPQRKFTRTIGEHSQEARQVESY